MTRKIIVRAALGILVTVSSSLFWLLLFGALNNGPDWLEKSLWDLAAFLFLGVAMSLAYLLEERNILYFGLPPLIILPALVFLPESLATGFVLSLALVFLSLAAWRVEFEKSLRIEFVSWVVLKRGLGAAITALALVTTLFFYFAPFTQSLEEKVSVPRPLFDAIAKPTMELLLPLALPPGFSANNLPPDFYQQQEELLNKVYVSTNDSLTSAGQTFKKWLPLGAAVSLFFAFKIVGTFLSFIIMALAWLVFRALLLSGVVKITKTAVEKETITI